VFGADQFVDFTGTISTSSTPSASAMRFIEPKALIKSGICLPLTFSNKMPDRWLHHPVGDSAISSLH
jgi:hypothetical protein